MSDEGKNNLYEGIEVWCKIEEGLNPHSTTSTDSHSISSTSHSLSYWRSGIVKNVRELHENHYKIEIQIELTDKTENHDPGDRILIKTKEEEGIPHEYQHVKLKSSLSSYLIDNLQQKQSLPLLDLPTLTLINEPEVLERIRICHLKNIRYLTIGPIFLFLSRFETIPSVFNPNIYKSYYLVDDFRRDILNPTEPHIAQLVNQIHLKVSQTAQSSSFRSSQAIIMLGESGSGKSKAAKDICSHLAYLASTTIRKSNQSNYVPDVKLFDNIHCILDSFGHAQTSRNPHSSRYSKAIKVSYDDDTSLIKSILYRCFHLEFNRIIHQSNGESNFRVFYDVFDDIYFAAQALSKYGIDNLTMFQYTSKRPKSIFQPGKSSYKDLSAALEFIAGIPKAKQNSSIFGLLAAILHLGELEFDVHDNYGDISTVLSSDPVAVDHMNRVMSLLGISFDNLYSVVAKKNLNFAGNIVEKNLDLNESIAARDTFACQLYATLFRYIVAKINEGIASKLSTNKSSSSPQFFQDQNLTNDDFLPEAPQNIFYLYDLTGFENLERNSLDQLCINYANERLYYFLNQIIYILDKELFYSENISNIASISVPQVDNSLTIRLLDNRSNGIFTICDDQLKLKSSTSDEKLANILYTQHNSNKNFTFTKTEQKNCEFIIKHYVQQVKYQVSGFTTSNKLEPSSEILDCLKSSSLSFIKDEILAYCDFKTLSAMGPQTGLSPIPENSFKQSPSSRNLFDKSPSSRNLFDKSPSSRNVFDKSPSSRNILAQGRASFDSADGRRDNFVKQRSFAHSHSAEYQSPTNAPGRGLMRGPSMAMRGSNPTTPSPRNTGKSATLSSLCSAMMTEILAEAKLCDVTFFMCLKLNDSNDPMKFDQHTVLRQLKPFGIVDILSYYHQIYPYRVDHVSFLNRYCILSLICPKDTAKTRDFMIALWECRSHGLENIREWKQLCSELVPLIPSLPECDKICPSLGSFSDQDQMETIRKGIRIGEANVYLTAISYSYLMAIHKFAIEFIKQRIWSFFQNRKTKVRVKAGVVIGTLMKTFLERSKKQKETFRISAAVKIQALIRRYLVQTRLKKVKLNPQVEEENEEVVEEEDVIEEEEEKRIELESLDSSNESVEDQEQPSQDIYFFDVDDHLFPDSSHQPNEIDDVSHNQLTNDIALGKHEIDSIDSFYKFKNPTEEPDLKEIGSIDTREKPFEVEIEDDHVDSKHSNSTSHEDEEEDEEDVAHVENLEFEQAPLQHEVPLSPPQGNNLLSHFDADSNSVQKVGRTLQSPPNGSVSPVTPPPLSLAQQAKINELQSKVDFLEAENSRLRRKLESLSTFVIDEEKSPEVTPVSAKQNPKKFATRLSSMASCTNESVYGGDLSRAAEFFHSSSVDIRPDYEKYVQKTLQTLDEGITYLLESTPFYKFGRSGSVHKTLIQLSPDFRYLQWKPKNPLVKTIDECRIDLRLVWRLVQGQSTPPFQAYKGISHGPMPPHRSFSLVYGFRSLDLCALDDETFENWFVGLKYLLQLINGDLQEAGLDRQFLRKKWNFVDRMNHGFLSRREIIQLVSNLGIQFDRSSFTAALLKSTIGNSTHDEITFSQFDSLIYQLRRRPDLEILWSKVISGYDFSKDIIPLQLDNGQFDSTILHEVIGINTFREFWKVSQNRVLNDDEAKRMIAEGMGEMHQEDFPVLSYNGFVVIMTHLKNDAYDPVACVSSNRSMLEPLQHYYISCADGAPVDIPNREYYNSILLDDVRPNCYVTAIQNGCRALELRCFEEPINPQGEQTDLFVGNPRNKERVSFKETLLNIHRVAFSYTHFPLILLVEISCGIPQQKRAAKLLLKLFGDSIYTPAETKSKLLPSPMDLKNRVIIFLIHRKRDIHTAYRVSRNLDRVNTAASLTGKAPRGGDSFVSLKSSQSFDSERRHQMSNILEQVNESFEEFLDESDASSESEFGLDPPISSVSPKNRSHSRIPRNDYLLVDQEALRKDGTLDKSQMDLIQKCDLVDSSLMNLCHYSRGLRIGSHPLRDMLARLSVDQNAEDSLIHFNSKRFSYIYMDQNTKSFGSYGGMVNAWDCGFSLVSLCHEYPSLGTKINSGRFRQNGNCGYVLKPQKFRRANTAQSTTPYTMTLHIISGKDLPVPTHPEESQKSQPTTPVTPANGSITKRSFSRTYSDQDNKSVDSRLHQTPDLNSIQEKSERVRNKGFNVIIDLNGATCDDVQNKTRYLKRHGRSPYWNEVFTFSVKNQSEGQLTLRVFYNDVCSSFVSIPLSCLRSGFRSIALYDEAEENNFAPTRLTLGSLFVRVRFDPVSQYNTTVQSLPENLKIMEEPKKSNVRQIGSDIMFDSDEKPSRRKTEAMRSESRDLERTRSNEKNRKQGRDKAISERVTSKGQSLTSSRGYISYDSSPILDQTPKEETNRALTSTSNANQESKSQEPKTRSRRDTNGRRKSENYEVSEDMTNHYKNEENEGKYQYYEIGETEKEVLKSGSRIYSREEASLLSKHPTGNPPPPPPPPPRVTKSLPPNPLNASANQHDDRNDDEHLPSYNSAVNLIELRQQNAPAPVRSVKKFDIDSEDESPVNSRSRPSEDDPWTPPV